MSNTMRILIDIVMLKYSKKKNRVIMFLCKERFLMRLYSKLWSKKYVLYTIINKINDNIYIINLLNNMGIFIIFNVFDIYLITLTSFYIQIFIFKVYE
jgi:hypothetical protein